MNEQFSIGVDLGGTNLRIAAYALSSNLQSAESREFLDVITLPTRLALGKEQVVQDMSEAILSLINKYKNRYELAGVGIGSPGPLELPEGIIRNPPNLPGWDGFYLRAAIEAKVGVPVVIEGDANVAALAELLVGRGAFYQVSSLCALTLGTGVGSGFILNGGIWHGKTGMGGEAGHVIVETSDGALCGCGGTGCLEQYASATAIMRMAQERMGERAPKSTEELSLMARQGDSDALEIFKTVGRYLAIGLTAVINTLNVPLYLIGGGVSLSWDLFAPTMIEELRQRSYVFRLTESGRAVCSEDLSTRIEPAELSASAGLLGACLLPFQVTEKTTILEGV